jgi:hypothetical protein
MKIMILATAALVATTLGAHADVERVSVSTVKHVIGDGVVTAIERGDDGRGISEQATTAPGRPDFAPVEGTVGVEEGDEGDILN